MIDDECGADSGLNEWQGKPRYSEKTYPSTAVATTDPTLSLARVRTGAAAVGCQRLIGRATAQASEVVGLKSVRKRKELILQ
jgi:hypothetical protein